jgi:hypothetical protein
MDKIHEKVRDYPNGRLRLVTPQERRQLEQQIYQWNTSGRTPRLGLAPCMTCSREYEACIVYDAGPGRDEFASDGRRGDERFDSSGGDGGSSGGGGGGGTGGTPPSPPAPPFGRPLAPSCRDQVIVDAYSAEVDKRVFASLDRSGTGSPPDWRLSLGSGGIRFNVTAHTVSGPIPPEQIDLHFVQNVGQFVGEFQARSPVTGRDASSAFEPSRPDCGTTMLDMFRDDVPPPPFFRPSSRSKSAGRLALTAIDQPHINGIRTIYANGSLLNRLFVALSYRMHLVCSVGSDHRNFETLQFIDWGVQMAGALTPTGEPPPPDLAVNHRVYAWPGMPYAFHLDEERTRIAKGTATPSTARPPRLNAPTFNQCYRGSSVARP